MKTKRHSILIVTAVIFGVLLMIPGLGLAKYPTKPITLVAPYGPGGASDLASRTLAAVAPALNATIPYKWDQFTFLGLLELNPFLYVVKADSPYKTLDDLLKAIKAEPGQPLSVAGLL